MTGIYHNGVTISVEDWKPIKKKPVLVVRIDGDKTHYKVADFENDLVAQWFVEVFVENFKDVFCL